MRVYCYCPETGVYQGEDFLDECQLDIIEGVTRIAPPKYVSGEVPVFDTSTQSWKLTELSKRKVASVHG